MFIFLSKHSWGMCGPDGLDLVNVILKGPHSKFSAQGPEFLATALAVDKVIL